MVYQTYVCQSDKWLKMERERERERTRIGDEILSSEEKYKLKDLNLPPSFIHNGCKCGHGIEYRGKLQDHRKNKYGQSLGPTIRPRVRPITLKLRC